MRTVNSYNLFDENNEGTILYHAIACNEDEVRALAQEAGIDIQGLKIEIERHNVKDGLGRPYSPKIEDALIH